MALFYIFVNLLNVWLNRKQWSLLPLNSGYCLWIQSSAVSHVMKPLENSTVPSRDQEWKSQIPLTKVVLASQISSKRLRNPWGSLGHTLRTTALVPTISPLFRWQNWGFQWESVFLRFLSWPVAQIEDQTSYLSPRFSPQNNVYLLLDFFFNTKQIPRHLIMLIMEPQLLK